MTKLMQLRILLQEWRHAERDYGQAVLMACLPSQISAARDREERCLHALRLFVDSEPWAEIEAQRTS